jgi:hypothetical protein
MSNTLDPPPKPVTVMNANDTEKVWNPTSIIIRTVRHVITHISSKSHSWCRTITNLFWGWPRTLAPNGGPTLSHWAITVSRCPIPYISILSMASVVGLSISVSLIVKDVLKMILATLSVFLGSLKVQSEIEAHARDFNDFIWRSLYNRPEAEIINF